jgi:hypothetical protein
LMLIRGRHFECMGNGAWHAGMSEEARVNRSPNCESGNGQDNISRKVRIEKFKVATSPM